MRSIKPSLLVFSLLASISVGIWATPTWLEIDQVLAKSSGGRSGGGSFRRSPSAPSRSDTPSRSNDSSPSRQNNDYRGNDYNRSGGGGNNWIFLPGLGGGGNSNNYNNNGNNGYVNRSSANDGSWIFGLVVFLILLAAGGFAAYFIIKSMQSNGMGNSEIDNDKVTVTKLQVALLAEARAVQRRLTEISSSIDTETSTGLSSLMQEAVVALLRTPENWAYVLSSVQATNRDMAEQVFNQLSLAERTKFSEETLVNVGGSKRQSSAIAINPDKDPAAYIVVTLLVGTAHDKPLFGEVKTQEQLQQALEKIGAISADYLLAFEVMWTPQAESDSLTYDELLTEYTTMTQL